VGIGHGSESPDREGAEVGYAGWRRRKSCPCRRQLLQASEVLHDWDAGPEKQGVRRTVIATDVVDVDRVDPHEPRALLDQSPGACLG
jgi:hypothetical protein